ncbi:hypothetical protein EGI15_13370 [Chryseobacterium cucumeris]|uniref:Type I restriction modification DNA specificity domain-containing protein n=1 Tax=Chryseobacterium cucumeris TaxID=1813611 RepID=A0ABX9X5D7_9FLAO|nr:restriction endonuclease subunit S [Chryseobacterium cucumeris]ROH91523.1 hypothetical protein EGI15_13370 [Chryseobacterium cucumeris]
MDNVLYEIPNSWKWVTLDDIGIVVSGGTPSTKEPEFWNGDIPWITPADLSNYNDVYISNGARNISQLGLDYSSAYLLPENTIVFSSRAPIGYVAITKRKLATNQGFKNLILLNNLIDPKYIYYYLKSIKDYAENISSGTTFLELSAQKFKNIPLPLPPTSLQNKISSKIDELFSEIDNIEENLKLALKNVTKLKYQALNEFFIASPNFKSIKIKNIGVVSTGKTPSTKKSEYYGDDYNFYKPSDFKNEFILSEAETKISQKGFEVVRKAIENSILVTCIGTIGKVNIVKKEGGFNQQINAIVVNSGYLPEFVMYACLSQYFQDQLLESSSATTISIVNKSKFENLKIHSYDIEKQKYIVEVIESKLDELNFQEKNIIQELNKTSLLRKSILIKAFNGHLIVEAKNENKIDDILKIIKDDKINYIKKSKINNDKKTKLVKKDLHDIIISYFNSISFRFEDLVNLNLMSTDQLSKQFNDLVTRNVIIKKYDKNTKTIRFFINEN